MSINSKEQIKCPSCGTIQEMTVWQSITAEDSTDLKEDLLKGKVNMFRCTECGATALFPEPILYTDSSRNLMISFSPTNDAEEKVRLFEGIKKTSRESGELNELEDYNLRFTTAYNELLEKILIFDNGLDDKTIEVLKLLVLMQESDKMDNRVCMFGKADGDMIEFMVQDKKEGQLYTSRVPIETYRTVKQQLKESGVKDKSFDWEIVDLNYASALLRGTNNNVE